MGIYGNLLLEAADPANLYKNEIISYLNKNYNDVYDKFQKILSRYPELEKANRIKNFKGFTKGYSNIKFHCWLFAYRSKCYKYTGNESVDYLNKEREYIKKFLVELLKEIKGIKLYYLIGYDGYTADGYKADDIDKPYDYSIKNNFHPEIKIEIYAYIDTRMLNSKILPNIEKKDKNIESNAALKYDNLYTYFADFIYKPQPLHGGFRSSHLMDICKIIGLSSDKLSKIVSEHFKSTKKANFVEVISDNPDADNYWKRILAKHKSNLYSIDEDNQGGVIYSSETKTLYWYEWEDLSFKKFYIDYPFSSKELEDYTFNDSKTSEIRALFKAYDEKKKYNIFSKYINKV